MGPEGPHWPSAPLMHHQCTSLSHSTTYPAPQGRCTREHLALAPELANSSTNPALGYQCMIHCGLHPHKSQISAVRLALMSSCSKYIQLKGASHVSDTIWAMDNMYMSAWVRDSMHKAIVHRWHAALRRATTLQVVHCHWLITIHNDSVKALQVTAVTMRDPIPSSASAVQAYSRGIAPASAVCPIGELA